MSALTWVLLVAGSVLTFLTLPSGSHGPRDLRLPANARGRPGAVDAAYDRMLDVLRSEDEDEMLSHATPGERMLYALETTDDEIGNGGLFQMFLNLSPARVTEAVAAARQIGAPEYADLLARAIARFPGGDIPKDGESRSLALGGMSDERSPGHRRLDPLDRRWRDGMFARQLRAYVVRHPAEFFRPR